MTDQGGDGSWIRGLARTWIYTSVQEASNRGNRAAEMLRHYTIGCCMRRRRIWSTGTCKNVGARTWARTGGCTMCCCEEWLCCQGLCRGSEALGSRGAMMCAGLQNRVGEDFVWVCALVHTGVLGRTGSRRHRRRNRRAVLSMWGTRTSEYTRGSEHKI